MKLYFLRHGKADWPGWDRPDDERPLTEEGKEEMRRVAKFLPRLKVQPASILSSPLPRAWQTAEIVAERLKVKVQECVGLQKGFNRAELRRIIQEVGTEDLMIVG